MPLCDLNQLESPQHVSQVAQHCTQHMQNTEMDLMASPTCSNNALNQPELSDRMRSILVSWLIEVHLKFDLRSETLFITINLVDRYCSQCEVSRSEYQLLGVSAMLIACKYEEIYVPKIEDFVDITDNTYEKHQILEQEFQILRQLDFQITFPTILRFVERFHALSQSNPEVLTLACYLCELTLIEVKMNKWTPSRIASSALYLAKKMLRTHQPWSPEM
jgi:G2/mitotic-specific cyclin-B, other